MAKLPSVTSSIPRDLQQFILRVKETLEGTGPDAMVSARQLIAAGIAEGIGNGGITAPVSDVVDPPRAPTGVSAAGALATIIVSWDSPAYRGHAYSEIWAASRTQAQTDATPPENPIIGQAELVGMTAGNNFSHNLGSGAQRWYWVRFVNRNGVAGPYNLTDGTFGETSQDPEYMLEVLTDAVTSSQLATTLLANINTTFSQASAPTQKADATALVSGDLWYDTDDGDKLYRYDGTQWVNAQDGGIAQAIAAAGGAQSTADGKITTYYQDASPSNSQGTLSEGDLWVDTNDGNNLYRWNNATSSWIDIQDDGIGTAIQDAADAQSTADGKITSYYQDDEPPNTNGELSEGDLWTDTNDNDSTYRWDDDGGQNGTGEWVRIGLASFTDVNTSITDQVGYCELSIVSGGNTAKSVSTANTTQTACQAAQADANKPSNYTYAWKSDGAIASELKTVTSSVDGNTATIQINTESIDGIEANFTVKTDVGGHIAGFGLLNTVAGATPTSEFGVRADKFFIAPPSTASNTAPTTNLFKGKVWVDTSATPSVVKYYDPTANSNNGGWTTNQVTNLPFIVNTTPTTINGQNVPAGAYMDTAFIADATITQAQIGALTADVITSGLLTTADFYGNVIAGSTIYLGGTVTYNQTNGVNTSIASVSNAKAVLSNYGAQFAVDAFTIDNPGGTNSTPFSITNDVVEIDTALIRDGTITMAKIENSIQSTNYVASGGSATPAGWKLTQDGTIDLTSGTVTAGTLKSTDGNFVIDLTNGTLTISV